ncbi:hypothetical protein FRC10_006681, partial [Ceratobasidium sp. 414]
LSAVPTEASAPFVGPTRGTTTTGAVASTVAGGGTDPGTGSMGTRTGPGTSTCGPGKASQVPKHRHLVASNVSEHSHFVNSLDPAALIARLKKYIKYDPAVLDLETARAILKEYITDSSPAVESPKQQVKTHVLSEGSVGLSGGYHMAHMEIDEPSRSAKRPSTPPVARPSKRPKVTIEEIPDKDDPCAQSNTATESESEPEPEPNDTATESESELKIPITHRTQTNKSPHLSTSWPSTQTRTDPPSAQPWLARQPSMASSRPGQQSQASSRVRSEDAGAAPRQDPHNAKASASTAHSGMPSTREKVGKPTAHERDKRARLKAAARMFNLDPKPLTRRGIRLKHAFTSKTAKVMAAVRDLYDKLFHAAPDRSSGGLGASESHGNLDDDLVPDNEEERVAKAAEAAGEEPVPRKRKPSSRDIHGYEKQILTTAKMHLFAITLLEGVYQTQAWFLKMARIIFIETWRQELPNVPIQAPSEEILQIMVNSLATARGQIKLAVRPIVEYGLEFLKWDSSPKAVDKNIQVFSLVHPNTFHCLEFRPAYGHYESSLVTKCIAAALFNGPNS